MWKNEKGGRLHLKQTTAPQSHDNRKEGIRRPKKWFGVF